MLSSDMSNVNSAVSKTRSCSVMVEKWLSTQLTKFENASREITTAFGVPDVPDVHMMYATRSGFGLGAGATDRRGPGSSRRQIASEVASSSTFEAVSSTTRSRRDAGQSRFSGTNGVAVSSAAQIART